MTTVIRRTVRSTPFRDAVETWKVIVKILTRGESGNRRKILDSVAGIAASLITDRSLEGSPLVATCDGPRTRIYCVYDEEAIDDSSDDESVPGFDPLSGDWQVSLPCPESDLDWVTSALEAKTSKVVARDLGEGFVVEDSSADHSLDPLVLDPEKLVEP